MLVKRAWADLNQGDMVYAPHLKLRLTVATPAEGLLVHSGGELYGSHTLPLFRYEGMRPYHVSKYGVETGEVLWAPVE